jgi:hypothetical protein
MTFKQAYWAYKENILRPNTPQDFRGFLCNFCTNCGKQRNQHETRKCLFTPTTFQVGRKAGARYQVWLNNWQKANAGSKYSTNGLEHPFWDEEM